MNSTDVFVKDFIEFCKESMDWCSKEAESATDHISQILHSLVSDAKRISSMSEDSLKVLNEIKKAIDDPDTKTSENLSVTLREIANQSNEVNEFVSPIIESLQFQDRIRQNMENQLAMLNLWNQMRKQQVGKNSWSEKDQVEFGKKLLEHTTMPEERDIIRQYIPGLPQEEATESVLLF